ncbi:MAG: Murein DD-endopeptidase MepM [Candidatus Ordinivivax streblomastigis]|uniref:Murein DD-endopeptidase MepM n=1 Tax=Candidatus Ordinivivax streblomastigis TaxID=2540710 RepID=A0A5M8P112_9BACT|nr:MAG: Murein DD-endopeptidase MepM [Candidatus Ordinivivax streblomastigis]
MSKIFYKYNPQTLNYERVYPTAKQRIWSVFRHLFIGVMVGAIVFWIVSYKIDSPQEKLLKKNYILLLTQYQLLSRHLEEDEKILTELQQRDEDLYRVMFNADPLPREEDEREHRYDRWLTVPNAKLVIATTQKLDKLTQHLYVQSCSYDELVELIKTKEERIKNIPAIMPLSSKQMNRIGSGFGMRVHPIFGNLRMHTGIDLNAPTGTLIYATGNGIVESADWDGGYGYSVVINHAFGYKTRYGHCQTMKVRAGQKVSRGQIIATVGSTGTATGSHLHYEVIVKGQHDNPAKYFFMDLSPEEYSNMLYEAENR